MDTSTGVALFRTDNKGYEAWTVDGRYCAVHTLVAIADGACPYKLFASGRRYHVHHINEVSFDNRPSNLRVLTREEHCRLTHTTEVGAEAADPTNWPHPTAPPADDGACGAPDQCAVCGHAADADEAQAQEPADGPEAATTAACAAADD